MAALTPAEYDAMDICDTGDFVVVGKNPDAIYEAEGAATGAAGVTFAPRAEDCTADLRDRKARIDALMAKLGTGTATKLDYAELDVLLKKIERMAMESCTSKSARRVETSDRIETARRKLDTSKGP